MDLRDAVADALPIGGSRAPRATTTGCNASHAIVHVRRRRRTRCWTTAATGRPSSARSGSSKGTDFAFSGAVDALQINDVVYDFEPNGVFETTAP